MVIYVEERISTICLAVLTHHQRVTDWRETDEIAKSVSCGAAFMNECGRAVIKALRMHY